MVLARTASLRSRVSIERLRSLGLYRREADAAVSDHHRGHAEPAPDRAVGVPKDLRIEVGVEGDDARSADQVACLENTPRLRFGHTPDLSEAASRNRHVAREARRTLPVDDGSTLEKKTVTEHGVLP